MVGGILGLAGFFLVKHMTSFGTAADHEQPDEKKSANIRGKRGEILSRVPYEKDKVVFHEGQDGTDAFVLESGKIGVFKTIEGKKVRLAVLEPGAMFGEMAAITGERRAATTIALEHSTVVKIPKSTMQNKMNACDPFIKALLNILINNLRRVNERYVTTTNAAEKLLGDLKAAHVEKSGAAKAKSENAPATGEVANEQQADKTGPRGADGAAPT